MSFWKWVLGKTRAYAGDAYDDAGQEMISAANAGRTALQTSVTIAENANQFSTLATKIPRLLAPIAGRLEPVLAKLEAIKITPELTANARSILGWTGAGLMVAQSVHDIYEEKGVEHKMQRAGAAAATIGAFYGAGALTGGELVVGGVAATGTTAVVGTVAAFVAPVVLTAEVAYGTNTIINTERTYESVDSAFKPDTKKFSNLIATEARVAGRLKTLGATQDADGHWDMTNPDNVAKFKQAIAEEQAKVSQVMAENDTVMPRWMQWTDHQADERIKFEGAQQDQRILDSALTELPGYQQAQTQHYQQLSNRTQMAAGTFNAGQTQAAQQITDPISVSSDHSVQMPLAHNPHHTARAGLIK